MEKIIKTIPTSNKGKLILISSDNGLVVIKEDTNSNVEYSYNVAEGDLVMLLNYYVNCKSGIEESDYIAYDENFKID